MGPRLLDLMQAGASADQAMAEVVATAPHVDYRQLLCVDAQGRVTVTDPGRSALQLANSETGIVQDMPGATFTCQATDFSKQGI